MGASNDVLAGVLKGGFFKGRGKNPAYREAHMSNTEFTIMMSCIAVVIAFLAGLLLGWILVKGRIEKHRRKAEFWRVKFQREEKKHDEWLETFHQRVEQGVEEQIRTWDPDYEDIRSDVEKAEYMALNRRVRDAGRSFPPREDAGPPATISRLRVRRDGRN